MMACLCLSRRFTIEPTFLQALPLSSPITLAWLSPTDPFPPTAQALDDPNGLLAAGADLSPARLLDAYTRGIFPWYSEGEPILWWSPTPRCVFLPHQFHASRSLQKRWRSQQYRITLNHAFTEVMYACATVGERARQGTWISPDMQAAYTAMHQLGWAHSLEVWRDETLIGGLYGLAIGRAFFGESMFSYQSDGSKLSLWKLQQSLDALGFLLIDCQVENPHLLSLGAQCLPREAFNTLLSRAILAPTPVDQSEWAFVLSELDK